MERLHKKTLQSALAQFSLQELQELDARLHRLIEEKAAEQQQKAGREVVEVRRKGGRTYRLEKVYCGKGCRGCPHGPYWYAYWKEGGRTRSAYMSKTLKKDEG